MEQSNISIEILTPIQNEFLPINLQQSVSLTDSYLSNWPLFERKVELILLYLFELKESPFETHIKISVRNKDLKIPMNNLQSQSSIQSKLEEIQKHLNLQSEFLTQNQVDIQIKDIIISIPELGQISPILAQEFAKLIQIYKKNPSEPIENFLKFARMELLTLRKKSIENSLIKVELIDSCTVDIFKNQLSVKLCSNDKTTLKKGLTHWESVFQSTYKNELLKIHENNENPNTFTGWQSTLTGKPIPENEMKEWIETTVDKILPFKPSKILELGSGSGLIVERLAPVDFCTHYLATDLSSNSISLLKSCVSKHKGNWSSKLEFEQGDAQSILDRIIQQDQKFDMIILNSVVQYFPSSAYMTDVLEKSVKVLNPNGTIFVGDIRNVDWVEIHMNKLEIHITNTKQEWNGFWNRVNERIDKNFELCLGPKYFQTFIDQHQDEPNGMAFGMIDLHRGDFINEMVYYRYNIALIKTQHQIVQKPAEKETRILWNKSLNFEEILIPLSQSDQEIIIIENIPNQRLFIEAGLIQAKHSSGCESFDFVKLLNVLKAQSNANSINPETVAKIGEDLGYTVKLSISECNYTCFNAEFYKEREKSINPKFYKFGSNCESYQYQLFNNPSYNKEKLVAKTVINLQISKLLKGSSLPNPTLIFVD